ncbi:MAG TPA: MmgE/PrpD family protein [Candidatus Dormibacteraeota bacterium]|nr:MmgE/PrpD family protein [Candidatus Dormibacteraeota bacterium]
MGVTKAIARFASELGWDAIPPEVVEISVEHLVDSWGVMLAGSQDRAAVILRQVLGPGPGVSPVLGTGTEASALTAAFSNGIAGHALDYDDTQLSTSADSVYGLLTHPSVPVTAAVGALAVEEGSDGRQLVTAYVAGVEVACRVADSMNRRHYQDGFHSTGSVGTLGAAAGSARLLGLDPERTATAIGIAASLGAGLRENFGTMTKPLHAGRAAHNGVLAARLAEAGFTASEEILEAPRGFFQAAAGGYDPSKLVERLGRPFFLQSPGVSIKPYPSGSLSHPAQDLVLEIVEREDLAPGDIESIEVGTNSNVLNALIHHRPTTGLQGKFSLEYCVATGVVRRRAGIAEFTDEAVQAAAIQEFIPRVQVVVDPELEELGFQHVRTRVGVALKDGRRFREQADWARGYPQKPLTAAQLGAKFLDCAEQALSPEAARRALTCARGVVSASSVAETLSALQP